jgi:uncharacterized membrane protein
MWTRELIKTRAKAVLKTNYWEAFLVSLVVGIASGGFNIRVSNNGNGYNLQVTNGVILSEEQIRSFLAVSLITLVVFFITISLKIFLGYCLEVGGRKFFIKAAEGESKIGYLGLGFRKEYYSDILITMLLRSIYTFLWTLLFIIPGIIKSYAYSMVPYILADNPNIGYKRAIELSNQMTQGEKLNMFILDLSFLGWYLLGMLVCCIGVIFVPPYDYATKAELYLILRKQSIESNITSYEELNIKPDLEIEDSYN